MYRCPGCHREHIYSGYCSASCYNKHCEYQVELGHSIAEWGCWLWTKIVNCCATGDAD